MIFQGLPTEPIREILPSREAPDIDVRQRASALESGSSIKTIITNHVWCFGPVMSAFEMLRWNGYCEFKDSLSYKGSVGRRLG